MDPEVILFWVAIIAIIVFIVVIILLTVAEWRIMTKAGEKGWKSLIPFYSVFVSHHIAGMSHVWFIIEVITWITEITFEVVKSTPEPVVLCFGIATGIFTIISEIIHIIKLCDCFGKGTLFKIGMMFFSAVFFMIIAFGKAEYRKPEHIHKKEKEVN